MADIQLRFHKDMLVLSTPFECTLYRMGYEEADRDYAILCEPEVVEEAFRFESMAQTPVFVLPTETMTNARLMHSRFEGNAASLVESCYGAAEQFSPQHVLAAIGPTGLPLDESSKTSLRQSMLQYRNAVTELLDYELDGIYFEAFDNGFDLQCALMGARAVYDGTIFASFDLDAEACLPSRSHELLEAVKLACEYGADVVGFRTALGPERASTLLDVLTAGIDAPLLVELTVGSPDRRQALPTPGNPYPRVDHIVDAALKLRRHGVQFVRAVGNATPAYTGSLVALLSGLDVKAGI